jgi:hypothetical protein
MVAVLEITTVSSCTVRCLVCPQDLLKESYRKDSAHRLDYHAFVDMLTNIPVSVRIHFSGFVEPWLNPDCTKMLFNALYRGHHVGMYTTCVGMTTQDREDVALILSNYRHLVDVVCVHLPDGVNMNVETEGMAFIHELRRLDLKHEVMKMGGPSFEAIDRAGNVTPNLTRHKGPIRCSYTDGPDKYDHNVLLPNGDVHLCCMDYSLRHRLGNLFEQSWDEIQNGEPMRALREANATDGDTLCRRCHGAERK